MVWIPVVSRGRRRLAISCWKHPQLHYKLGGQGRQPSQTGSVGVRVYETAPREAFFFFFLPSRGPQTFVFIRLCFRIHERQPGGGVVLLVVCRVTSLSSPSELVL